jgi:hypothetical protein
MNIKNIGAGVVFFLGLILLGFVVGGFLGGRVFGGGGMGWDQLADALGGAFLGIITAIVVATITVGRFTVRHRLLMALGGWLLAIGLTALMRAFPARPIGATDPSTAPSATLAPKDSTSPAVANDGG